MASGEGRSRPDQGAVPDGSCRTEGVRCRIEMQAEEGSLGDKEEIEDMRSRTDPTTDYDEEIDALFESFSNAPGLLATGRMAGMGVALTDHVKERLVERHGEAANFIVYNTGRHEDDLSARFMVRSSRLAKPSGLVRLGRTALRLLGWSRPAAEPTDATEMPRWMKLIRDRETDAERRHIVREKVLGRHRPEALH